MTPSAAAVSSDRAASAQGSLLRPPKDGVPNPPLGQDAPDPEMARRRLGFYARCGLRTAGYDTEMFGVHYKTLYLAGGPVDDAALMEEHRFVYENTFSADKYHKYVRIPFDPKAAPGPKVPWQQ